MEIDINEINAKALEKVIIAQPILNKIKLYPELVNVHDSVLSALGDSRWNGHFVLDTFDEIISLYEIGCYNEIMNKKDVPVSVKKFFNDMFNYKFGSLN
jgi:hypothetical protein